MAYIYTTHRYHRGLVSPFELASILREHEPSDPFPLLSAVATDAICMPVASVDCERDSGCSQYKHLNSRRVSLSEESTRRLVMLYHNSDTLI